MGQQSRPQAKRSLASNPTQTITVTIQVITGTDAVSHAITYTQEQFSVTGNHSALMAGFKAGTTPAVIKALEESKLQFDSAGARLAALKGVEPAATVGEGEAA